MSTRGDESTGYKKDEQGNEVRTIRTYHKNTNSAAGESQKKEQPKGGQAGLTTGNRFENLEVQKAKRVTPRNESQNKKRP